VTGNFADAEDVIQTLSSSDDTSKPQCRPFVVRYNEWVERLGPAPDICSAEINHWLLKAAIW